MRMEEAVNWFAAWDIEAQDDVWGSFPQASHRLSLHGAPGSP